MFLKENKKKKRHQEKYFFSFVIDFVFYFFASDGMELWEVGGDKKSDS